MPSIHLNKFLTARKKLEKALLFDTFKIASAAVSGAKSYGFENIVGVGIGEKLVNGNPTGEDAIRVYVIIKAREHKIDKKALVPSSINGIQTDVVEIGEIRALANVGKMLPAPGGVSIGHYQITAGTLGCLVQKNGRVYILSNNHVLANINAAGPEDPILQPGPVDGGRLDKDVIGHLSEFVPIQFNGAVNTVDAAIARSTPPLVTPKNKCFGTIDPTSTPASRFMLVKKCGRSTELTRGLITDVHAAVKVSYGVSGTAIFQDQIIIQSAPFFNFSQGGDSGSLIVTESGNHPTGLLFAGTGGYTIANKIENVLAAFAVKMYT
jgi:hypothetical protein